MKWGAFSALSSILAFGSGPGRSHRYTQPWTSERRIAARDATKALWQHGFDSYMDHAYPFDELSPISCTGQGPDWKNPAAIHLNDVNANVSIALLDNLDSFVVLRNQSGFAWAVNTVLQTLSFDVDTKPQVFEITIRGVGSLLSAHMFANDKEGRWGFGIEGYDGGLLRLAKDLGERLLPAFNTPTGMPYARVNLRRGVTTQETTESCTAGAGSLLLEFTTLSRLTGDPRFEAAARRAFFAVWNRRSKLGLVGNAINVRTGDWIEPLASGIGAGIDSFFEYALKMYIMSGEEAYLDVWNDSYGPLLSHSRSADGFWFRSIAMRSGELAAQHIDSLGAFWPGLQVLAGDLENAIKSHLAYWGLWKRFSGIPETFNIYTRQAISLGYPLRPEFIESTYFLYQATHDSFYLDVGARILEDLNRRAKVQCGLATISNLLLDQKENRMESFALSETLKYLYLLFDEENPLNKDAVNLVFTTEGHPLPVMNPYRTPSSLKPPTYRTHENHTTPILDPPSDALLPPQFPVRQGAYSRRSKTCPRYRHPHIPSLKPKRADQPSSAPALLGTIRDRGDFEYARLLSGISVTKDASQGMGFPAAKFASTSNAKVNQRYDPESWKYEFGGDKPLLPGVSASEGTTKQLAVVTEEDKEWWDAHGSCEVPKVEEYVVEWLLSHDGDFVVEDRTPSADKVALIHGGLLIYNVSGLRVQATARLDLTGYDITQVGPYALRQSDIVWVHDPVVTKRVTGESGSDSGSPNSNSASQHSFLPDVYLRFSYPLPHGRDELEDLPDAGEFPTFLLPKASSADGGEPREGETEMAISFDLLAATASFGGNPGIPRMLASPDTSSKTISPKARAQKPLQFGHESPLNGDIHLMLPEDHNLEGCEDHHPGLRAGYLISPDKFFSAPSSSSADSPSQSTPPQTRSAPEVSVLLLRRGGCAFLRKLAAAKAAGFAGAIVWNSQNEGNESEYASSSTGGLINPSIDVEERAYADRELMDVGIVVVTREDGRSLERLVRWAETRSSTDEEEGRRRRDVVVEVFREPPPILFDHDVEVIDMDADLDMEIGVVVEEGHAGAADQAPKVPPTPKAGGAVEGLRALQDLLQEQQQKQQSPPALSHSAHRILYINGLALRNTRLI